MKLTGNTVLITGGGSGIGEALAHRFHDLGNTVIIAGRREDALRRAAAGRSNIHALTLEVESVEGVADFARRLLAGDYDAGLTHLHHAREHPERLRVLERYGCVDTTWVVYGRNKRFQGQVIGQRNPWLFTGECQASRAVAA